MNGRNRRFAFPWCLVVALLPCGNTAEAAPPAAGSDSRTALAIQLVDKLKARAVALPESPARDELLRSAAAFDYLLGRKESCVRFLEAWEAEAAAAVDPAERFRELGRVAQMWAVAEPDRARRLLMRTEREIETLPEERRGYASYRLADAYFELGDYDRAFDCVEAPFELYLLTSSYETMAQSCLEHGLVAPLEKLRNRIRQFHRNIYAGKFDVRTEQYRVETLAAAGLPEEAAALYEACRSIGTSDYDEAEGLGGITRSFAMAGNRDAGKTFLRKQVAHVKPEAKCFVAVAAVHVGDYELVDELLAKGEPFDVVRELRKAVLAAHHRGDVKQRDKLFDRYRDLLSRMPKGDTADWVFERLDAPTIEAAIGRYDAALAMLPKLKDREADFYKDRAAGFLNEMLIDMILREQGKMFGRLAWRRSRYIRDPG